MAGDTKDGKRPDLFRRLELELRRPKSPLIIDRFLPAPETIASSIPSPVSIAAQQAAAQPQGFVQQLRAQDPQSATPEPVATPRRRKRTAEEGPAKSLQDEIAEFMSRGGGALAPDIDPDQ